MEKVYFSVLNEPRVWGSDPESFAIEAFPEPIAAIEDTDHPRIILVRTEHGVFPTVIDG
jgi:hypothetical protein